MGHMLEDRYLRRALLDAMAAEPLITHMAGTTVVAQNTEGAATVTLADGRILTGRLLIGADGRRSGTADRAGIKRTGWDYGQTALVCAIAHEKPHHGIAHQFFMPAGPLAILPLTGNRSSIVWSERTPRAAEIAAMSDADYLDALRPAFGDFLGEIALAGARYSYPLSLSIATAFVAPRLALVGDAAHGVHPIAGQGLNLGLRDVAALAEVLTDAAPGGGYRRPRRACPLPDLAPLRHRRDGRCNRCVQPPVLERQSAPACRARCGDGPGAGRTRAPPPLHPGGSGPHGRPATPVAGPRALMTPRARSPSSFQQYAFRPTPKAPGFSRAAVPLPPA
jgi:2-polyprenyl-6-methoxyphenol hydroxylase-like FAD-dependent oxidoreductase